MNRSIHVWAYMPQSADGGQKTTWGCSNYFNLSMDSGDQIHVTGLPEPVLLTHWAISAEFLLIIETSII